MQLLSEIYGYLFEYERAWHCGATPKLMLRFVTFVPVLTF